jgi:hypothetical protein
MSLLKSCRHNPRMDDLPKHYSDNGSLFYLFACHVNYLHDFMRPSIFYFYPSSWKASYARMLQCVNSRVVNGATMSSCLVMWSPWYSTVSSLLENMPEACMPCLQWLNTMLGLPPFLSANKLVTSRLPIILRDKKFQTSVCYDCFCVFKWYGYLRCA